MDITLAAFLSSSYQNLKSSCTPATFYKVNDHEYVFSCVQRATSGLDRGLAASPESTEDVERKAAALERAGRIVDLSEDLKLMQGLWKLVYSSGFQSGSLGGRRPGPEIGRTPIKLGEVWSMLTPLHCPFICGSGVDISGMKGSLEGVHAQCGAH